MGKQESLIQKKETPTILLVEMVVGSVNNALAVPVLDSCDIEFTKQMLRSQSPDDFRTTLLNVIIPSFKDAIRPIADEWRPWVHYRDEVRARLVHCEKNCLNCPVLKCLANTLSERSHRYCEG